MEINTKDIELLLEGFLDEDFYSFNGPYFIDEKYSTFIQKYLDIDIKRLENLFGIELINLNKFDKNNRGYFKFRGHLKKNDKLYTFIGDYGFTNFDWYIEYICETNQITQYEPYISVPELTYLKQKYSIPENELKTIII